jgi:hypothetical protein
MDAVRPGEFAGRASRPSTSSNPAEFANTETALGRPFCLSAADALAIVTLEDAPANISSSFRRLNSNGQQRKKSSRPQSLMQPTIDSTLKIVSGSI